MKSFMLVPALSLAAAFVTGCGDMKLGDKVQLNLDIERQSAQLTVELSDGLQVNMLSGSYPIANGKGQLVFIPASKTENARIGVEVNLAALAAGQFTNVGTVSSLPNGSPLPVAITPPLLAIPVISNKNFDVDALLSITPELQIAATVGIAQFSSQYVPMGLSLCQNFRNEQNVANAAICIYGPGAQAYGGIFVGANLGAVLDLDQFRPNTRSLLMASAAPQASILSAFSSFSSTSEDWSYSMHNPENISTSKLLKMERNVRKILSAR